MSGQTETDESTTAKTSVEFFDAVVIGSGFGGAVAACRLAQAGKKICILERGRRYGLGDFPRPAQRPDHLPYRARWVWAIDHGLLDPRDLQGMLAVVAAGYGGGSLIYANVHLRAPKEVFSPTTKHGLNANGWPAAYTREALDPYYDTVAAALRVRPHPGSSPSAPAPKLDAMRAVAAGLGRQRSFFLPPLAIDFDKCVGCAECVAGCQLHAKNTLDLNYLAVAEQADQVDVRTLAEATDIGEDAEGIYTVTYRDHVTGQDKAAVRATSVFLCAGALNSTHLLLRSKGGLPNMPPQSRAHIGRRFFGNGDAIAMVFDTTKGPAPDPTKGPTITTTLLYTDGARNDAGMPNDWFIVQDGGYPSWLEPAVGLFRGEFWLGRNRIVPPAKDGAPTGARATGDLGAHTGELERALHGLLHARSAIRKPGSSHAGTPLASLLPPQIEDQLVPHFKRFVRELESSEADSVDHETLDEVNRRVIKAHPWQPWLKWFVKLANCMAEPELLPATLEILHRRFLRAPPGTADPFTLSVLWPLAVDAARRLFLGRPPNEHALLLLAIGVDSAPGRLYRDDSDRLLAYWDVADNAAFAMSQERLLHDIATELGGELRLNPDAAARQRPVTVHCLGGCAMADDPGDGVTDPDGKVWGTRALYVLDGAAIPGSLGSNPSATIAAIAERNVRRALEKPDSPIHTPTPVPLDRCVPGWPVEVTVAEIQQRLGQTPQVLDPIASLPAASPAPRSAAIGFAFQEWMHGFYRLGAAAGLRIESDLKATIGDLSAFLADPLHRVGVAGTVTIWPAPGSAGEPVAYAASGTLDLLKRVGGGAAMQDMLDEARNLLAASHGAPSPGVAKEVEALLRAATKQGRRYKMEYRLDLKGPGPWTRFEGLKKLYGAPGLDPWTETTTLEVTLRDAKGARATGVMRVHIADFLTRQLPSFTITGTDDQVRIAWAFGRFFRFFLGALRHVYLPHIDTLNPFGPSQA